jgi:hypothetical protein
MLKGCFVTSRLQVNYKITKNNSDYRISYTITYKIYNSKNDRLQQQDNQLSICVCAGYQSIKASYQQFITIMRSSSIHHHEQYQQQFKNI